MASQSETKAKTIEIDGVGPIEHLVIPIPKGRVIVLRGRNGAGKTQALRCAESLLRGEGRLSVHDGTARGSVAGLGVRIGVGRSTRRVGELEAVTLEGAFDVARIVDPGFADPGVADASRIKALLALRGTTLEPGEFLKRLGLGDDAEIVGPEPDMRRDVVDTAAQIKGEIEKAARKWERQAANAEIEAVSCRLSAGGVDLEAPHDAEELQRELERAVAAHADAKARQDRLEERQVEAASARKCLEQTRASYTGPSVQEAALAAQKATTNHYQCLERLAKLRDELAAAEVADDKACLAEVAATKTLADAQAYEKAIAGWGATIEAGAAGHEKLADAADTLANAAEELGAARNAVETGALVRRALQMAEQAKTYGNTALRHKRAAERLRNAAHAVDDVLSQLVASDLLQVKAGRLVTQTSRGETVFGELSDGERWKIATDLAIEAVGDGGLFHISQEAWQALDPDNRRLVAERVGQSQVTVITAEATDGELRAEEFVGEDSGEQSPGETLT